MRSTYMKRFGRWTLRIVIGVVSLIVLVAIVSLISNLGAPTHSQIVDRLGDLEKARIAEAIHLRQTLGETVWQGWGQAEIPAIAYNESYAFLVDYPDPPAGWVKVPEHIEQGGEWQIMPEDQFAGRAYYRQQLLDPAVNPQSFAVLVGDRWVYSLASKEWMLIFLDQQVRDDFGPLFPHRLFARLLIGSSETYIGARLHEPFHAFQGMVAPTKLEQSERTNRKHERHYPFDNPDLQNAWHTELDLLADALVAPSPVEQAQIAQHFLAQRKQRRTSLALSADLVAYEQQREWLEGLAKYVELAILRQAANTEGYNPHPAITADPAFYDYSTVDRRWSQEIAQIRRMANDEGDKRFYFSGMAQAVLLDQFLPGWKERILNDDVQLEELLAEALRASGLEL